MTPEFFISFCIFYIIFLTLTLLWCFRSPQTQPNEPTGPLNYIQPGVYFKLKNRNNNSCITSQSQGISSFQYTSQLCNDTSSSQIFQMNNSKMIIDKDGNALTLGSLDSLNRTISNLPCECNSSQSFKFENEQVINTLRNVCLEDTSSTGLYGGYIKYNGCLTPAQQGFEKQNYVPVLIV